LELELSLADSNPALLFGLNEDFISSPRLDNLFSAYFAIKSLADQEENPGSFIDMVVSFDHEEIGSVSH